MIEIWHNTINDRATTANAFNDCGWTPKDPMVRVYRAEFLFPAGYRHAPDLLFRLIGGAPVNRVGLQDLIADIPAVSMPDALNIVMAHWTRGIRRARPGDLILIKGSPYPHGCTAHYLKQPDGWDMPSRFCADGHEQPGSPTWVDYPELFDPARRTANPTAR